MNIPVNIPRYVHWYVHLFCYYIFHPYISNTSLPRKKRMGEVGYCAWEKDMCLLPHLLGIHDSRNKKIRRAERNKKRTESHKALYSPNSPIGGYAIAILKWEKWKTRSKCFGKKSAMMPIWVSWKWLYWRSTRGFWEGARFLRCGEGLIFLSLRLYLM